MRYIPSSLATLALLAAAALSAHAAEIDPAKPAYLYATYAGDGNGGLRVFYSTDRLTFDALWEDYVPFKPSVDGKLLRDPYLYQAQDGVFHLVFTSSLNGKSIGYARTTDLQTWTDERAIPLMEGTDAPTTFCPEIKYDETTKRYMVYWYAQDKVQYAFTTDFKTFTKPQILFDLGRNGSDPSITRGANGKWVMMYNRGNIVNVATADKLLGPYTQRPEVVSRLQFAGSNLTWTGEDYIAYQHQYAAQKAIVLRSKDLATWENITSRTRFPLACRQGNLVEISGATLKKLLDNKPASLLAVEKAAPAPAELAENSHWIDELNLEVIKQGSGAARARTSVEGRPLTLGGKSYERGVGSHALADITILLNGNGKRFQATVGIDDEVATKGSARVIAYLDGVEVARSALLTGKGATANFDVDLAGKKELLVRLAPAGENVSDHVDLVNAQIQMVAGSSAKPTILGLAPVASAPPLTPLPASPTPDSAAEPKAVVPPPDVPMPDPMAIEHPTYRSHPKPILKNLTSITTMSVRISGNQAQGFTHDFIATVPADSRTQTNGSARLVRTVGKDMQISFEEAERAVKMRYPRWTGGRIDVSFDDKYTNFSGGSAGTAFAILMLSTLEGFSIDPKCAFTGDITVDWKVRPIGGVPEKLRGAAQAKCLYAAIPVTNVPQFGDAGLLFGHSAYWDLQVFAVETVQQAAALARTDRDPKLTEAMKLFAALQPELTRAERVTLQEPNTKPTLQKILELAPNHLSAKLVLALAENTAPKTLTPNASDQQLYLAYIPYIEIISSGKQFDRTTITPAITVTTRRRLDTLRPIIDPGYRPILVETSAFIETLDGYIQGRTPFATLKARIDALQARAKLSNDPNAIERRINTN